METQTTRLPNPDLFRTLIVIILHGSLIIGSLWLLSPFLPALAWAAMIVISSWKIMLSVERRLRGSRSMAVFVMTSGLVLLLIVPLTVAVTAIIENVDVVSEQIQSFSQQELSDPPKWLEELPIVGSRLGARWRQATALGRDEIITRVAPYIRDAVAWILQQLGGLGWIFLHFLLTVLLAAILYAKGEIASDAIMRFARRLAGSRGEGAVTIATQAVRAVATGVVLTALIQGLLAGIGLLLAGVPYTAILSCLAFLLGVVQIGPAPVLIGAIIWLFNSGATVTGWCFVTWSVLILVADNFIRPFLIKRGADLPLLLIFAGVIGGLISFGVIGLFIGPVVLAVGYTLLQAWIDEVPDSRVPQVTS